MTWGAWIIVVLLFAAYGNAMATLARLARYDEDPVDTAATVIVAAAKTVLYGAAIFIVTTL